MTRAESCPGCGKPVPAAADHRWRPFCSERCKMSDLGLWFAERYVIPDDNPPDTPDGERPQ